MENAVICQGHLLFLLLFWYMLWPFGMPILWLFRYIYPVLVCCAKKNLATLIPRALSNIKVNLV
jgi:hypothetical protein